MENKLNIIISIVYKAISVSTERNKNNKQTKITIYVLQNISAEF